MVVARVGDTDDGNCSASGCVDGDYLMRINVAFQSSGNPDPVCQLRDLFDDWRADLVGRTDECNRPRSVQIAKEVVVETKIDYDLIMEQKPDLIIYDTMIRS